MTEYCGKRPPEALRTRMGQSCVMVGTDHSTHRAFDLAWTDADYAEGEDS